MINEQCIVTDYLEEHGLKENDKILVTPASGKRYEFSINRTCFDFVSDAAWEEVESFSKKKIVGNNREKIHVQLKLIQVQGRNNSFFSRYYLQVKQGGAVRLNGTYVFEALIERGDICELGFNELKFMSGEKNLKQQSQIDHYLKKYKRLIQSDLPILIQGETGVGKTTLARKIHENSGAIGHFVHLNIASFSPQLIESELFGHVKGAFTGAYGDKKGAFKQAENGTLFIDEIDSLPWELQTKLLIFLDEFKARAVGDTREYRVHTRLIFASGRKLSGLVETKLMRKDFYFRLTSGHVFKMQALRDEPEYVIQCCKKFELKHNVLLDKKLMEFYASLPWPGNYRQLMGHLLQKKVLAHGKKFTFDETDHKLIEQSSALSEIDNSIMTLKQAKLSYAQKAFLKCDKNYHLTAEKLSISTRSLKTMLQGQVYL